MWCISPINGHVQIAWVVLCHIKICCFSLNGPCWCKNLPFLFKLCRATCWHTLDHIMSLPNWLLVIRSPYSKKSNFLIQSWLLKTFDKISSYLFKNYSQITLISASTVNPYLATGLLKGQVTFSTIIRRLFNIFSCSFFLQLVEALGSLKMLEGDE